MFIAVMETADTLSLVGGKYPAGDLTADPRSEYASCSLKFISADRTIIISCSVV